ncbi:hepatitis A virus cellular receptor 2 isoform X2 [Choloepus didactylus]|uniref:hepatitis A virus cellular receptor 2 isoform X2 n=1 Tax=Choloepus didactylus TaxID=27675 RepID=UPI00189F616B|nr:hepatitis A virus cellular receptor 2 isoform X2 [Choloepus didactylus]
MFSHLSFNCVLLLLLLLTRSLEGEYTIEVGQNALLPCTYNPTSSENLVPVCWGHGSCPVSKCRSMVLSTNGRVVDYRISRRYQLKGNLYTGDVSLTIEKVTPADSGTYCCRVEFPGLWNDKKSNLELVIKPAKVATARTPRRDFTTGFPRMLTTEDQSPEIQTQWTLHNNNQTKSSSLAKGLQDSGMTRRMGIYIGAGVLAGLVLTLILGVLILKWYTYSKEKLQNLSLVSMANLSSSGIANAVAEGMHAEENIYTIEENVYEIEDPNEYYCYVSGSQ